MMKAKVFLAGVVSATAIASGVLLSSTNSAEACTHYREKYEQTSWLNSPLALIITLPGVALATALYVGGRSYQN